MNQNTQLEILKLLQDLKAEMKLTNSKSRHQPKSGPYEKTPDDQTQPRRFNTKHYCWTCGAANHPSIKCRFKAPGHKDEATCENKIEESKAYCS